MTTSPNLRRLDVGVALFAGVLTPPIVSAFTGLAMGYAAILLFVPYIILVRHWNKTLVNAQKATIPPLQILKCSCFFTVGCLGVDLWQSFVRQLLLSNSLSLGLVVGFIASAFMWWSAWTILSAQYVAHWNRSNTPTD